MSLVKQKIQLSNQIKAVILNFYGQLPCYQLHEKVRTQIIPLLITLFFDDVNNNQQSFQKNCNSPQTQKNILKNLQNILVSSKQNLSPQKCSEEKVKNNKIFLFSNKQSRKNQINNFKVDIQQLFNKRSDLSVQDLIMKTLAVCKIWNCLLNVQCLKDNKSHIYEKWHQSKIRNAQLLKWWQKYSNITKLRITIMKFYQNYRLKIQQIQGSKALHKLYILKLYKYYSTFKNNLTNNSSNLYLQQNQKFQKLKIKMIQRGFNRLCNKYLSNLKVSLTKIIKFNISSNPWKNIWIKTLVLKTPANFQTSFWRLKNFSKKFIDVNQNIKPYSNSSIQNLKLKNELSQKKQKSIQYVQTKKILQSVQQASNNMQVQAILFTKQQKAQILWNQIQFVDKLITLSLTMDAFSFLQSLQTDQNLQNKFQKKLQQHDIQITDSLFQKQTKVYLQQKQSEIKSCISDQLLIQISKIVQLIANQK